MSWESEYEAHQMRLRNGVPRCDHRAPNGERCPESGKYLRQGYFPLCNYGVLCPAHWGERAAQEPGLLNARWIE